jgi:hypothetical protein
MLLQTLFVSLAATAAASVLPVNITDIADDVHILEGRGACPTASHLQCVGYGNGKSCSQLKASNDAWGQLNTYIPSCSNSCYQYDQFTAVVLEGGFGKKTTCTIFSDVNCKNKIRDLSSGLGVAPCADISPPGKSMKCYWGC